MCIRKVKANHLTTTGDLSDNVLATFFIPDGTNSITATDIRNGRVRITKENKQYFPDHDCDVNIKISDRDFSVKFRLGNNTDIDRSLILKIGLEAIMHLGLDSGDTLFVKKVGKLSYIISK